MTAATSAGSRPFFSDCWRMMSSCRSGRVISCTACLSGCSPMTNASAPSVQAATTRRSRRRRARAARRAAAWGGRRVPALAVAVGCILSQPLQHCGQLRLQLLERAVIPNDEVRFLRLFVLRELPRGARFDQLLATGGGAPGANFLIGKHNDRLV